MNDDKPNLRWLKYPAAEVAFGPENEYVNGRLTIAVEALRKELLRDPLFESVDVELVAPNERARIINIVDIVEPRLKPDMEVPDYYPGVGTDPFPVGFGDTNVLSGIVVMTTALLQPAEDMVVSCEPGQRFRSHFAEGWNLVISPHPAPGAAGNEFARAVAGAGCRAAVFVARATLGMEPAEVVEFRLGDGGPTGPRIGYICYLYSHGFGRQKFLYGVDSAGMLPTVLPITSLLDGALVDNGYTRPVRNSTYELANNAMAYELAMAHGRDHCCAGLILVPHAAELRHKVLFGKLAARIARDVLGCDGVVVSKDGGGQADVDVIHLLDACESLGLKAVAALTDAAYQIVTTPEQAGSLVSLGNLSQLIHLEPIERVVGGVRFGRDQGDPWGSFSVPVAHVPGLIDMMAGTRVRTVVW